MCGVAITCGNWASDQSVGGSCSNTSSAAPPTIPLSIARRSAFFVDQLAARRIHDPDSRLAPREPFVVEQVRVSVVDGRCSVR